MLPDESAIEIRDQLRQLAFDVSRVAGIGAQVFLGLPRSGAPDGRCQRPSCRTNTRVNERWSSIAPSGSFPLAVERYVTMAVSP